VAGALDARELKGDADRSVREVFLKLFLDREAGIEQIERLLRK